MGVKYLRVESCGCAGCYFDRGTGNIEEGCLVDKGICHILTGLKEITAAEFNTSTGKKWRVKKDGRVLPYENYI